MPITSEFCWRKAIECHRLTEFGGSPKQFFQHSRNAWIMLANHLMVVADGEPVRHEVAWDALMAPPDRAQAA